MEMGKNALMKHQPISEEVAAFAENLAVRANSLATRVAEKLSPVTTGGRPGETVLSPKLTREYPPLFLSMNSSLQTLQSAMDDIEEVLSRTEL